MRHNQATDKTRAYAPTGLPDIIELTIFCLKLNIESFTEIRPQVVTGACLKRQPILHHCLDRIGFQGARKLLSLSFYSFNYGHSHYVFRDLGVEIENTKRLFNRFVVRRMRSVSFLPKELRCAKEHPRAKLPSKHICPLID